MKTIIPLLAIVFLSTGTLPAQKAIKMKIADDYFSKFAYVSAIPYYEDLAAKEDTNRFFITRLANCYRLTGNSAMSEIWYEKLIATGNIDPVSYYYYGQMLEENGKYDEAKKSYQIYKEKNSMDSRGSRKTAIESRAGLYRDSAAWSVIAVPFNSAQADFGLFPVNDTLLLFTSNRPGEISVKHTYVWNNQPFLDLFSVKRKVDGTFSPPVQLPREMNSQYHEGPLFFDRKNKTFFITRNNFNDGKYQKSKDDVNKLKLYFVQSDGTQWGKLSDFEYNDNEYSVGHAALSSDGSRLYFSSDMPGGYGLADIYVSKKEGDKWGKPENIGPVVNTEGNEMFPFVSDDEMLYFSSDGHGGLGGLDIYKYDMKNKETTKTPKSPEGDFNSPPSGGRGVDSKENSQVKNLGYPVCSSKDDFSFYISPGNLSGYFASNRITGVGDDDIYAFTVLKRRFFISGKAIEKETGTVLSNAQIALTDETDKRVSEISTGKDGSFNFEVEQDKSYQLNGKKESYFDAMTLISTHATGNETEFKADVRFEKDPGLSLFGLIRDKANMALLQDVHVTILDRITNVEIINLKTPAAGDFRKPLEGKKMNDKLSYLIKLEKEGYLAKSITFDLEITKPGEIMLHEALDIAMDKIEIGTDIGKVIDIQPIYFDLAKWSIRKDAAVELDKIVKVMNENPGMIIELGSHTDCRSSAASNMALSGKRAKASADYIKKQISNPERIYGKGYGESQPVNQCECEGDRKVPCTEEEHQMNRRTEFKVVKM